MVEYGQAKTPDLSTMSVHVVKSHDMGPPDLFPL
jgi:hypothetical protein